MTMKVTSRFLQGIINHSNFPIILLLTINIITGCMTFRDYGLSWDEPLFYRYADAIGYAYSIQARIQGTFDIEKAFGPSAYDHRNRGPAYLLIAHRFVSVLEDIPGVDNASAWHLTNFLTFQVGVFFLYGICRRWVKPWSAFAAAFLFSSQPLLWGHAFINPKDPPFMVFFLGTIYFGLRMVDELVKEPVTKQTVCSRLFKVILSGIFMGLATSIRILGPLAGGLIIIYAILLQKPKKLLWFIPYGLVAALTTLVTWPFLWADPINRLIEVIKFMSSNPTQLPVLFMGTLFRANELPRRYFPLLLGITLTEPVGFLFAVSLVICVIRAWKKQMEWKSIGIILAWFVIPFSYVIVTKPSMYDGYRHFLFIIPPIFILTSITFDAVLSLIYKHWVSVLFIVAIAMPGIYESIHLHPYEYTYYNAFTGGISGAFRKFETDYWLTCYKETMEKLNQFAPSHPFIFVHREYYIAGYYAADGVQVKNYRGEAKNLSSGNYILVSTRANDDQKIQRQEPVIFSIGRDGAIFCVVKQVR